MRKIALERRTRNEKRPKTRKTAGNEHEGGIRGSGYSTTTNMMYEECCARISTENRDITQGKASPPGDADAITSEWGEHNTIPIVTRLTSGREEV